MNLLVYSVSPAHALPMFRDARQRSTRKQLEKDRLDPKKSHKPEPPVSGPGDFPKRQKKKKNVSVSAKLCLATAVDKNNFLGRCP